MARKIEIMPAFVFAVSIALACTASVYACIKQLPNSCTDCGTATTACNQGWGDGCPGATCQASQLVPTACNVYASCGLGPCSSPPPGAANPGCTPTSLGQCCFCEVFITSYEDTNTYVWEYSNCQTCNCSPPGGGDN